jgi:hypothetical protein
VKHDLSRLGLLERECRLSGIQHGVASARYWPEPVSRQLLQVGSHNEASLSSAHVDCVDVITISTTNSNSLELD